jgi:hypothetical protein
LTSGPLASSRALCTCFWSGSASTDICCIRQARPTPSTTYRRTRCSSSKSPVWCRGMCQLPSMLTMETTDLLANGGRKTYTGMPPLKEPMTSAS